MREREREREREIIVNLFNIDNIREVHSLPS